ncbi:MAG: hypothetical protein ACM3SY_18535 [Candidatus Omnitrophota bacterium]
MIKPGNMEKKTFKLTRPVIFFFVTFLIGINFIFAEIDQVRVTDKRAVVREYPRSDSKILAQVSEGTLLQVKGKTGEWVEIVLPPEPSQTQDRPPQSAALVGYVPQQSVREVQKKDRLFIMGLGMLRINWADVKGNELRFRTSDLGLPADFSTRERASFLIDGTFGHRTYTINGHLNYDPENRVMEPPLDFLFNVGNQHTYLSVGDIPTGVMLDSIFTRYVHPFRGGIAGTGSNRLGVQVMAGLSRGESGIEELPADAGSGPYYLNDSPIIRGSEAVFLVTRNAANPDQEIRRTPMIRNRDYFMDDDRGSILFNYPLYATDEMGNPVYVLVNYQFETIAGRFSRAVYGLKAFAMPLKFLKLNVSYIADSDKDQTIENMFKNSRGIVSFGLDIDSQPLTLFSEVAFSSEPSSQKQHAFFGGGILTVSPNLHVFFNGWSLNADFPTFANTQLQYGYSLFQVFPVYAERTIFLSPFQFTRNLSAELYPFTLSRISVEENEVHGFAEWESRALKVSAGYGTRKQTATHQHTNLFYTSLYFNRDATQAWGKVELDQTDGSDQTAVDHRTNDIMVGWRQKLMKLAKGNIFVQGDYKNNRFDDFLDRYPDTTYRMISIFSEYLSGSEGVFTGYRKEWLKDQNDHHRILDLDVFEVGIRQHVYKGFFIDTRYRKESGSREGVSSSGHLLSLGAGVESRKFRAVGRYEFQFNRANGTEGKRRLWSLYLFGSPLKRMSVNVRYYKQLGRNKAIYSLDEQSEEELTFRFLWRPWGFLNLYSQWRYDTNLELYPPLDRTRSNSLASVQGLKFTFSKRAELLANYKLLKVWGPIKNRKYSAALEFGYLLFRHIRAGLGVERIDFEDPTHSDADYKSTVGYLKLVVLY